MPVPNGMEKSIKIHRESNSGYSPQWPATQQSSTNNGNQEQSETRTWSSQTVTKRVVQSSGNSEPIVREHTTTSSNKSSDLFSNAHDRRGSTPVSPPPSTAGSYNNTTTKNTMKSSSLVRNALQEFEDTGRDSPRSPTFGNQTENNHNSTTTRRESKTTNYTSNHTIPSSTPSMEIVPSSGEPSPTWAMGTDSGGDVPVTYEIVTKADGKKEFQLLLTAKDFSPEDLQVKLTDNKLYINGTHEERSPNGAYSQKSFYRSCTIPHGVKPEDLNCSLDSCGRLKITAPVPDQDKAMHTTTKTITTTSQNQDWTKDGMVPSGYKVAPGSKEQVVTIWNQGSDHGGSNNGSNVTRKEERTTTKTVRTFKTVA